MRLPSLTASLFEEYRARLEYLVKNERLNPIINQEAKRQCWLDCDRQWSRTYNRFYPGEAPWAVMVCESNPTDSLGMAQEICTLEVFEELPVQDDAECAHEQSLGWVRIRRFPSDKKLPALSQVLSEPGLPKVIRYRPNKRCTLRFDYEDGKPSVFAKVFSTEDGERLYSESAMLWQAAEQGKLGMLVAQPLSWDAATKTLWQARVPAEPTKRLYSDEGFLLAEKMGSAIGSIAVSGLMPQSIFGRDEQMSRTIRNGQDLCRRMPSLTAVFRHLVDLLEEIHASVEKKPLVAIHAAPHPSQWLESGDNLGLIDFDGFSMGEPELDIATFMSEVDFENPHKVNCVAVNKSFLSGYEAVAGKIDNRLLAAYCAHKRISKAVKYATSIRSDGDIRAEQTVGRALVSLLASKPC